MSGTISHGESGGSVRRAAIFDLDGTVIAGSTERTFARELFDDGIIGVRDLIRWARVGFRRLPSGVNVAFRGNRTYLAGKRHGQIREAARRCVADRLRARVFPAALDAARRHHEQGDLLVVLSGTLDALATAMGSALLADVVRASELESVDDWLTGFLKGSHPIGLEKRRIAAELASQYGFSLENCVAYADSFADVPLLESVGTPVAVNPRAALRRHARRRGWVVVDWSR